MGRKNIECFYVSFNQLWPLKTNVEFLSTDSYYAILATASDAMEKEMTTHSSVLDWRIPEMGETGGLPAMGLHRVGHDWNDLAAAAAAVMQTQWGEPKTQS